jgi:myo-inositol-1(or 4)-monophosphatase
VGALRKKYEMKLHRLGALVARYFSEGSHDGDQTVINVKDGNKRDVVTAKDLELHDLTKAFLKQSLPDSKMLSEEGSNGNLDKSYLLTGDVLVVDPLDGSNNLALGLPGYGYMACRLIDGRPVESIVVIPEQSLYLVWSDDGIITSREIGLGKCFQSAPSYYAYPPQLTTSELSLRTELLELIDNKTSGIYRYGAACMGLVNLMQGKHHTFIGQKIRLWDGLAMIPMLSAIGITTRYSITGLSLNMVASYDDNFSDEIAKKFDSIANVKLVEFNNSDSLEIL